jgi:hypothetical protein
VRPRSRSHHAAQRGEFGRPDGAGPADALLARQHPPFGLAALGGDDAVSLAFGAQLQLVLGGGPATEPFRTLGRVIRAAADGVLEPLITRYPLSRASDAHADLENRRTAGKIVLIP